MQHWVLQAPADRYRREAGWISPRWSAHWMRSCFTCSIIRKGRASTKFRVHSTKWASARDGAGPTFNPRSIPTSPRPSKARKSRNWKSDLKASCASHNEAEIGREHASEWADSGSATCRLHLSQIRFISTLTRAEAREWQDV